MKRHPRLLRENHHWWPQGLLHWWTEADGLVSRLTPTDELLRSTPKQICSERAANLIEFSNLPSPWDSTIETQFNDVDSSIPHLVAALSNAEPSAGWSPYTGGSGALTGLAALCVSLIVRSPAFRARVRARTEALQRGMGFAKVDVGKALVVTAISGAQKDFSRDLAGAGKFGLLFSDGREFIFGDGFFNNFTLANEVPRSPRFVIPLTPSLAVLYTRPRGYRPSPRISMRMATSAEVEQINDLTQIYSGNYVLFRSDRPALTDAFRKGEFLTMRDDRDAWLDGVLEELSGFGR